MRAVDPTIAAALITGGVGVVGITGAVITSVVGSKDTRRATEQAIAAAREDRLWERRCAAYEEHVAVVLYRHDKRQEGLREGWVGEWPEEERAEFAATFNPPGLRAARAKLIPYASDAVVAASGVCAQADAEVWRCYGEWRTMTEDSGQAAAGNSSAGVDDETILKARKAVETALQKAEHEDFALIQVIRDELRSKPEAVIPPAT